ncbi:L-lactate permease [Dethiobacter alkaliphilus]|uniref:L-lactate permease n=1 Tax=Dethiobacter alkaliphilus AHT 1 TaxID=555088 RepID=C0GCN0_DETAL|nr:L-lactate permease [Dethiobacter alkaliphilus]EEG78965.1 L-lactate permease [Dethiobacter alkaliphilus AHT 1]
METSLPVNTLSIFLSALPLIAITVALLRMRWSLLHAALLTCFLAFVLAPSFFGVGAAMLLSMTGKGVAFTLFIGIILITAILFYNLLTELGIMEAMGKRLLFLKGRPLLQVLFLAWCFAGFMEGFIGFGIPVVLVAPFLIIGGLSPFMAVALTLVGHAWAVTYGTLGVALFTLALASRIPVAELSFALAAQFTLMFTLTGFIVAHLYHGWQGVREGTVYILVAGVVAGLVFYASAYANVPQLSALLGGLAGAGALLLVDAFLPDNPKKTEEPAGGEAEFSVFDTFAPYGFLCVAAILFQANPIRDTLDTVGFSFSFTEASTALGFLVPAEPEFVRISLRHPGTAIFLATLFTFILYRCRGNCAPVFPVGVFKRTISLAAPAIITLLVLVTTAMIMNDSGMTTILALGVSRAAGPFYPVLAPFFGLLGTFLTGSNTNSNLLFGLFQHQAALNLGFAPTLLVASHTAAASVASSIAPAKILLGTSAIGNNGDEQTLLARTLPYCLFLTIAAGLATYIF